MTELRFRPSRTFLVAGAMVLGGFLLVEVSWWFMLLAAAGTFGPGILREFRVLRDKDELETVAMYRAGYHAFLVSGVAAFTTIAFVRSNEGGLQHAEELGSLFAAILWCAWMFSTLFSVWGAVRASQRILVAFGCVWLLFIILSNSGPEWTGPVALVMHSLIVVPYFALAWLCSRWPRVAALLLFALSVYFYFFFGGFDRPNFDFIDTMLTILLLIGPLLASGIALVFARTAED